MPRRCQQFSVKADNVLVNRTLDLACSRWQSHVNARQTFCSGTPIAEQHCPVQILVAGIPDHDLLGQKKAHRHVTNFALQLQWIFGPAYRLLSLAPPTGTAKCQKGQTYVHPCCETMVSWTKFLHVLTMSHDSGWEFERRLSADLAGKVQQPVRWPKREVCDLETSTTELIAEATWEVKPQQVEHVVPKVFIESLWPSELEAVGNHSTLAFSAPADLAFTLLFLNWLRMSSMCMSQPKMLKLNLQTFGFNCLNLLNPSSQSFWVKALIYIYSHLMIWKFVQV